MSKVMDIAVALTEDNPPQLEVGGDHFLVDVTLGIAVYPSHADDAATLFRRAELALKEAREKELAYDIYRPDATQQQAALWKFESELQSAVARGQLEVYFQPKVEIASDRVCGVEALVRWRTESGNFVPASDFIPLAESNGAIVPLTWLVFDRIVEQLRHLGRDPDAVLGGRQRVAADPDARRVPAARQGAEGRARRAQDEPHDRADRGQPRARRRVLAREHRTACASSASISRSTISARAIRR